MYQTKGIFMLSVLSGQGEVSGRTAIKGLSGEKVSLTIPMGSPVCSFLISQIWWIAPNIFSINPFPSSGRVKEGEVNNWTENCSNDSSKLHKSTFSPLHHRECYQAIVLDCISGSGGDHCFV